MALIFTSLPPPAVVYADIRAEFVDLGVINEAHVYSFDITSTKDIIGLDFSSVVGGGFAGNFNNDGIISFNGVPEALTFTPAYPQPGSLQETYFVFPHAGMLAISVSDNTPDSDSRPDATFLGAAFVRVDGGALIPANTRTPVAVFSTTDGVEPTFLGGVFVGESGVIEYGYCIPEPSSLILAGVGLVCVFCRSRNRS